MTARNLALIVVMAALITGCGVFVAPSPTAGEMGDLVSALVLRGATITDQVAGDAGCADPSLYGNAVRLDVRMPGESASAPVHLLRWKDQDTYDSTEQAFQACVAAFKQANPADTTTVVEVAPWRAFGPNWSPALKGAVEQALRETGGS